MQVLLVGQTTSQKSLNQSSTFSKSQTEKNETFTIHNRIRRWRKTLGNSRAELSFEHGLVFESICVVKCSPHLCERFVDLWIIFLKNNSLSVYICGLTSKVTFPNRTSLFYSVRIKDKKLNVQTFVLYFENETNRRQFSFCSLSNKLSKDRKSVV